jgi:hypothetical protein
MCYAPSALAPGACCFSADFRHPDPAAPQDFEKGGGNDPPPHFMGSADDGEGEEESVVEPDGRQSVVVRRDPSDFADSADRILLRELHSADLYDLVGRRDLSPEIVGDVMGPGPSSRNRKRQHIFTPTAASDDCPGCSRKLLFSAFSGVLSDFHRSSDLS